MRMEIGYVRRWLLLFSYGRIEFEGLDSQSGISVLDCAKKSQRGIQTCLPQNMYVTCTDLKAFSCLALISSRLAIES